jgi:hypothetical protein
MKLTCPHCHAISHFKEEWSDFEPFDVGDYPPGISSRHCWTCDNCGKLTCGVVTKANDFAGTVTLIWPIRTEGKDFPDVPEAIGAAANEAHLALGVNAPRASVAMARSTIESTAKDHGIIKGNLESKIDQLAKDNYISEAMRLAAHEIRFAGNEAAHGDLVNEIISADDAAEIIDLMDAILERVYQEPARVARVRENRERRKNRDSPSS